MFYRVCALRLPRRAKRIRQDCRLAAGREVGRNWVSVGATSPRLRNYCRPAFSWESCRGPAKLRSSKARHPVIEQQENGPEGSERFRAQPIST